MWTVLSGTKDPRTYAYWTAKESLLVQTGSEPAAHWQLFLEGRRPRVEVFVTVYGEPLETVRRTAIAALAFVGSTAPGSSTMVVPTRSRPSPTSLGCHYLRRFGNKGAKAGQHQPRAVDRQG
jgi:cellulose synthase (UDP-forming)